MPVKVKSRPRPEPAPPADAEVLTATEAAAFLRVTVELLLAEADAGRVPARKLGAEWRFLKSAIREWLSSQPESKRIESQKERILARVEKWNDAVDVEKEIAELMAWRKVR